MSYTLPLIAPSILSADFSCLKKELQSVEDSGADWIHLDVMDGHFVPNLSFGMQIIKCIRPCSSLPFDTHLMVSNPEELLLPMIKAGSDNIIFHLEAHTHAHRLVSLIRDQGKSPGISIVPSTPVSACVELLPHVDQVLVMGVNPGFGGQKFIEQSREKIKDLAELREHNGYSYRISIDGGVNLKTAPGLIEAGVDILISGSAFFDAKDKAFFVHCLRGEKRV